MNEGIIGIEGREIEISVRNVPNIKTCLCPILVEGCLCVKNSEVSNEVCRDKFRYCPIYVNLTDSLGTHIDFGKYRIY